MTQVFRTRCMNIESSDAILNELWAEDVWKCIGDAKYLKSCAEDTRNRVLQAYHCSQSTHCKFSLAHCPSLCNAPYPHLSLKYLIETNMIYMYVHVYVYVIYVWIYIYERNWIKKHFVVISLSSCILFQTSWQYEIISHWFHQTFYQYIYS